MAQSARVSAIVGDLVISFAKQANDKDTPRLKTAKDTAAKNAKAQQLVRTNQFEVDSTLDGLIEKFSIINRDDLAQALTKRLDELRSRSESKWNPELLSLFLSLANRPDQNSSLEALGLLKPPSAPASPVTWAVLDAEEPLEGDIWRDETYSSVSEDELEVVLRRAKRKPRSAAITLPEDICTTIVMETTSGDAITELQASQFWTQADLYASRPQLVSELHVIREVLLMLRGLPTSVFVIDQENTLGCKAANIMLSQISLSGFNDVLQSFASIGSDLLRLRHWARLPQQVALLQAFSAAISDRLQGFDQCVADIERRFVGLQNGVVVVSILQIQCEIEVLSRPFLSLSALVAGLPVPGREFLCLELLYDQLCSLHAAGDEECFSMLGHMFFECLNVYLRPIATWMEEGTIIENDESFFIAISDKSSALSSLWHERYTLRITHDGALHAPAFLSPAAKKILNAGKSIVFLQQLKRNTPEAAHHKSPNLNYDSVIGMDGSLPLLPFSELFVTAFSAWMESKYTTASIILKQGLFGGCDLLGHIDSLEHVYFSKDGLLFQTFADNLLKRMKAQTVAWNDEFLLTELARRTFGDSGNIRAGRLSVRTSATKVTSARSVKALTTVLLDINLPWPIQNIIQRSSLSIYHSVFTFILQIYYAKYLLRTNDRLNRNKLNRAAISLRQRLMWFVNVMHSYVLEVVVQSAVEKLREQLLNAEDVDEMFEVHENFVKKLELSCLLAKNLAPIHDSVISILDLTVVFSEMQAPRVNAGDTQRISSSRSRRRRRSGDASGIESNASSEGEGEDEHGDEDKAPAPTYVTIAPSEDQLQGLHDKFSQLLHFTIAGVRSVSRAGGQLEWEMLAERLEWGSQKQSRTMDYVQTSCF